MKRDIKDKSQRKRLLQDGYYISECYKNRLVLSMKEIAARIILFETMFNLPLLYKKSLPSASSSKIEKSKWGAYLS